MDSNHNPDGSQPSVLTHDTMPAYDLVKMIIDSIKSGDDTEIDAWMAAHPKGDKLPANYGIIQGTISRQKRKKFGTPRGT